MMELEGMSIFMIIALIVIAILGVMYTNLYASELPQKVNKDLTKIPVISLLNGQIPPSNLGPVSIQKQTIGDSWFYEITATPKLKLTADEAIDVISLIEFKGQGTKAVVSGSGGDAGNFNIKPDEATDQILHTQLTTEIPPITVYQPFSGIIKENGIVLVKNDISSMLVALHTGLVYKVLITEQNLPECHAYFELRGNCPEKLIDLKGCIDGSKQSDCEQSVDLCGGTANIKIYDKPDCSAKTVRADITYTDGIPWGPGQSPGETVLVSFWRDLPCTRQRTDFYQLVSCIDENNRTAYLGRFELNAGVLPD